jgi:hypothetical protein
MEPTGRRMRFSTLFFAFALAGGACDRDPAPETGDDTGDTGTPPVDDDGDGQSEVEGDCNDHDPSVYRGAPDTTGDGLDSNCDAIDSSRFVLVEDVAVGNWVGLSGTPRGGSAGRPLVLTEDATGDGVPDLLVGAPTYGYDGYTGEPPTNVYLLSGTSSGTGDLPTAATAYWQGEPSSGLGDGLASAGDIDGDGRVDVLAGAVFGTGQWAGIYLGGTTGAHAQDDTAFSVSDAGGGWVAGGRDLDGDGDVDFATAPAGLGTIVFLGPLGGQLTSADADVEIGGYYSRPIATRDLDADDDGYGDLLLSDGDKHHLTTGPFTAGGTPTELFQVLPPEGGGDPTFSLGDVDGDGALDLAYGDARYDWPALDSGRVAFFLGPLEGTLDFESADAFLEAEGSTNYLAQGLAIDGDLDGDGDDEIVVGAASGDPDPLGAVVVFQDLWTGLVTTASADLVIDGPSLGSCFGRALSASADVDGDGRDDLAAGAWNDLDGAGTVWLIHSADLAPWFE